MSLYKDKYRIESRRLKGYDYASPGEYFVTICTKSMAELFGGVVQGELHRSGIGETAHRLWMEIPKHCQNVMLDEFIVMPNHLHAIVVLCGVPYHPNRSSSRIVEALNIDVPASNVAPRVPASDVACNVAPSATNEIMSSISPKRGSLGAIIRSYKSAVSDWCHTNGFEDFQWQPRFHDRIIRNEDELMRIRSYIRNNPAMWETDRKNPNAIDLWME